MKRLAKSLFAIVVAALCSAERAEAGMIVDSFESVFQSVDAPGTPGALGGERDLYFQLDPGTTVTVIAPLIVDDGLILYGEGSNVNGSFQITWDGHDDNDFDVDPTGLGPTDVFEHSTAFRLTATSFDAANATMRVWSDGNVDAVTKPLAAETIFPFSEFGGANFASVGALQLQIEGEMAGTTISLVESVAENDVTPNPEPGSLTLLALGVASMGVGGIAGRRRRRERDEG